MSSTFANPSVVQTTLRQTYTPGTAPGTAQYDTLPLQSVFAAPTTTSDLRTMCLDLVLSGTTATTPVSPPAAWTKITKVTIVNLDTYNGVMVTVTDGGGNKQGYALPPNTGIYTADIWPLNAQAGGSTYGQLPTSWALTALDGAAYAVPATYPTSVRVIFCGYQ